MVTKGIVTEVLNEYKAKVRIPLYDSVESAKGSTLDKDLSTATICTLPNLSNPVSVGDVVYVSFEDGDKSKPVILGHLHKENKTKTKVNLDVGNITTSSTTQLGYQTSIGNIRPTEIARLTGVKENVQHQIDSVAQFKPLLDTISAKSKNLLVLKDYSMTDIGVTITSSYANQLFTIEGKSSAMIETSREIPIEPVTLKANVTYFYSQHYLDGSLPAGTLIYLYSSLSRERIEVNVPYTPNQDTLIDTIYVDLLGHNYNYAKIYMQLEIGDEVTTWSDPSGGLVFRCDPDVRLLKEEYEKTLAEVTTTEIDTGRSIDVANGREIFINTIGGTSGTYYYTPTYLDVPDGFTEGDVLSIGYGVIIYNPPSSGGGVVVVPGGGVLLSDDTSSVYSVRAVNPSTPHITITSGKNLPEIVDADFHVAFYKDGMFLGGSEGTHFNIPQGSNQMKISISSNTAVTCLGARFENPIVHKADPEIVFTQNELTKCVEMFDINDTRYNTSAAQSSVNGDTLTVSGINANYIYTYYHINVEPHTNYSVSADVKIITGIANDSGCGHIKIYTQSASNYIEGFDYDASTQTTYGTFNSGSNSIISLIFYARAIDTPSTAQVMFSNIHFQKGDIVDTSKTYIGGLLHEGSIIRNVDMSNRHWSYYKTDKIPSMCTVTDMVKGLNLFRDQWFENFEAFCSWLKDEAPSGCYSMYLNLNGTIYGALVQKANQLYGSVIYFNYGSQSTIAFRRYYEGNWQNSVNLV